MKKIYSVILCITILISSFCNFSAFADEGNICALTREEIMSSIHVGMRLSEVSEILGEPYRYIGSGFSVFEYVSSDGHMIILYFFYDSEGLYVSNIVDVSEKVYCDKTELAKAVLGSNGLKIIENIDFNAEGVTRAKVAEISCRILDMYSPKADVIWGSVFNDVDINRDGYEYILCVVQSGIMQGDGDGNFRPDDFCTYAEFLKTMLHTLGWGQYYDRLYDMSSYPYNYVNLAKNIGFCEREDNLDEIISVDEVFEMVYDVMMFNVLGTTGYSGEMVIWDDALKSYHYIEHSLSDDKTLLLYRYDADRGEEIKNAEYKLSPALYMQLKLMDTKVEKLKNDNDLLTEIYKYLWV